MGLEGDTRVRVQVVPVTFTDSEGMRLWFKGWCVDLTVAETRQLITDLTALLPAVEESDGNAQ